MMALKYEANTFLNRIYPSVIVIDVQCVFCKVNYAANLFRFSQQCRTKNYDNSLPTFNINAVRSLSTVHELLTLEDEALFRKFLSSSH